MKKRIAVLGLIAAMMIVSLAGCKGKDTGEINGETPPPEETSGIVGSIDNIPEGLKKIEDIKSGTMLEYMTNIRKFHQNFKFNCQDTKSIEKQEDGGYVLVKNRTVTATCLEKAYKKDNNISASLVYTAGEKIPSDVNVTYAYTKEAHDAELDQVNYDIITLLLNETVSNELKAMVAGVTSDSSMDFDDYKLTLRKYSDTVEEVTMDTLAVSIRHKDEAVEKDEADKSPEILTNKTVTLDMFSASENPQFGLFYSNFMVYGDELSNVENKIANVYGAGATVETLNATEYVSNESDENGSAETSLASGRWGIRDSEDNRIELYVMHSKIRDNAGEKLGCTYEIRTLPIAEKVDAFLSMEKIISTLTGQAIELQDKYDSAEFSMSIPKEKSELDMPLELAFMVETIEFTEKPMYQLVVTIANKEEAPVEPTEAPVEPTEAVAK